MTDQNAITNAWSALLAERPTHLFVGIYDEWKYEHLPGGQLYLATPYSREVVGKNGAWIRAKSVHAQAKAAVAMDNLRRAGRTAVSPIVLAAEMVHLPILWGDPDLDPLDDELWTRWCAPILAASCAVVVPCLPGWSRSRGVWHEVEWALSRNVPVFVEASEVEAST